MEDVNLEGEEEHTWEIGVGTPDLQVFHEREEALAYASRLAEQGEDDTCEWID